LVDHPPRPDAYLSRVSDALSAYPYQGWFSTAGGTLSRAEVRALERRLTAFVKVRAL
jgi:hypothetical protein